MGSVLGDAKEIGELVLVGGVLYFLSRGFQVRVAGNEIIGFGAPSGNTGKEAGSGNQPPAASPTFRVSEGFTGAVREIATGGVDYFPSFFGLNLFNSRSTTAPSLPSYVALPVAGVPYAMPEQEGGSIIASLQQAYNTGDFFI